MEDKLYSAVNNAVATIHNCDEEPIHIPGSIQPHGSLIVIDRWTGKIHLCSANTEMFFSHPPAYFLSKVYTEVLSPELCEIVGADLYKTGDDSQHIPMPLTTPNGVYDCFRRFSDKYLYLECVPAPDKPYNVYELFSHTNDLLKQTANKSNLYQLCNQVARKMRDIIEYDRVMVYRFDENYNGHVFAESISEGTDSFLDLHYPHTDIPKQASELYLTNLVRLIPDVNYTPVPIVTLDPDLARPEVVDLSNVHLRSVSPIHIKYLQNMGVGATFTISLIKDEKLWGLIACHHYGARNLSYNKQVQAYVLSQILTSQIDVQETAEKYTLLQELDTRFKKIMEQLQREENFIEFHFAKLPEVSTIVNAGGAALVYKNRIYKNGATPPDDFILRLERWMLLKDQNSFQTHELSKSFPEAAHFEDMASGVLFHRLHVHGQTSLFWFRPSVEKIVTWAGNPNKPADQSPLTPRNSFSEWKELKKETSDNWKQPELETAFRFSYLLQQHIFHLLQREEEIRFRKLNEQLLRANKELENINWIGTHDLKEPLRKIQIFASMIESPQSTTNVETVRTSIDRIRSSASRMQTFIDDLLVYSRMSHTTSAYEMVDLNDVLTEVMVEFVDDEKSFKLQKAQLPLIHGNRFQLQQLFVNLIGNAIKFRKENQGQEINISYEKATEPVFDETKEWHKITIADKGVGFSSLISETIFDIFKRGHSEQRFKGSGVGLSICRKIMENHGGKITAQGNEGEGAVFILYFPA